MDLKGSQLPEEDLHWYSAIPYLRLCVCVCEGGVCAFALALSAHRGLLGSVFNGLNKGG